MPRQQRHEVEGALLADSARIERAAKHAQIVHERLLAALHAGGDATFQTLETPRDAALGPLERSTRKDGRVAIGQRFAQRTGATRKGVAQPTEFLLERVRPRGTRELRLQNVPVLEVWRLESVTLEECNHLRLQD